MSSTIFFFLFIPLLAFILLSVNLIFAPHNPYMEKNSAFECGFSSFLGQNRTQFSISFFVFALLFLLFDLEILLVYPYLVSAYTNGVYGLVVMLMFLLALTLGFAFELGKKALSIDSRQTSNVSANNKSNYISKVKVSPFLQAKSSYTTSTPMLSMSPTTGVISIAVFNQIDNLALDILLMFFILFAFLLLSGAIVLLSFFIYKCKSIFKSKVIFWIFLAINSPLFSSLVKHSSIGIADNSLPNYVNKLESNKTNLYLNNPKRHYSSLSNNVRSETNILNDILYLLCRKAIFVLSCVFLLTLFLYFIIYIYDLTYITPYVNGVFLFLLFLINYTSNFYYINKAETYIKPSSNKEYILDLIIYIGLFTSELTELAISVVNLVTYPLKYLRKVLSSAVNSKIKSVIIDMFSSHCETFESIYREKGLFYLLSSLALFIYYKTSDYIHDNLYYMIGFQSICLCQAYLGHGFWLIIWLIYIVMHLPFFIISIATYITLINKNFYRKHPILFWLYTCACLLLSCIFIILVILLCAEISQLVDDYLIRVKGDNGNNGGPPGPGSGPGGEGPGSGGPPDPGGPPGSGPIDIYPSSSKQKGKQKETNTRADHTPHVLEVTSEYSKEAWKVHGDENLTNGEKRAMLNQLKIKRDQLSNKSSSSYSDQQALDRDIYYLGKYDQINRSDLSPDNKVKSHLALMKEENCEAYKRKISNVALTGHNRNYQSVDDRTTRSFTEGITKDTTAPNLGAYERSQRFEEMPKRPLGCDGADDGTDEGGLQVPIWQGLEPALNDPSKAPQLSNRIEDLQPDLNPASSQMDRSRVSPFSNLSSPPTSPRKRDKIKNLFRKKP